MRRSWLAPIFQLGGQKTAARVPRFRKVGATDSRSRCLLGISTAVCHAPRREQTLEEPPEAINQPFKAAPGNQFQRCFPANPKLARLPQIRWDIVASSPLI
jgi:hypothetical protein